MSVRGTYTAIAAAGCIAAAGTAVARSDRSGVQDEVIVRSANTVARQKENLVREQECRKRLYGLLSSYPASAAPLDDGSAIVYHAYPLSGPYRKAVFDSIGAKVVSFLSAHGAARTMSAAGLDSCLSGGSGGCDGFRYLITPLKTASTATEKRVDVNRFAKLDTSGNFVPDSTTSTLKSIETELRIRFVAVDLREKTVVFSDRIIKRTSSVRALDQEIRGRSSSKRGNDGAGMNENAYEAAEKLLRKLKRAFNGQSINTNK